MQRTTSALIAILLMALAAPAGAAPFAYLTDWNQNRVVKIDVANPHGAHVSIPVGSFPEGVAIPPDATRVYVANRLGPAGNSVSVINAATDTVMATIPMPAGCEPFGVAVNPAHTRAFVTCETSNTVAVIDTATLAVVATVPVGNFPQGIAVGPGGTKVFVANNADDTVTVINANTYAVLRTVNVCGAPTGVAVRPSGQAEIACGDARVWVIHCDYTLNPRPAFSDGCGAYGVVVGAAGNALWATKDSCGKVVKIDVSSGAVLDNTSVLGFPLGVSLTDTEVWAANHGNEPSLCGGSGHVTILNRSDTTVKDRVCVPGSHLRSIGAFIAPPAPGPYPCGGPCS